MHIPQTSALVVLASIAVSAIGLAAALTPRAAGPHDAPGREFDAEAYWLPRHREVLAERRSAYPVGAPPAQVSAKVKFRNPKRVSTDILGVPPATLPTAQAETQTEPYVAVNPADPDHLLAAWQETRFTDGGARSLGVAVSTSGGRRWTDALLPGLTIVDGGEWDLASDPWPTFGPDGIAYYNSLLVSDDEDLGTNAIAVSVSRDGGFTWGAPVEIVRDDFDFNDKNSMVADAVAGSRHRGNAYVGWDVNVLGNGGFGAQRMVVSRSTDEGKSWSKPKRLVQSATNIGIVMRVGPDGTLYAVWSGADAVDTNLSIRFAKSTNGGRRFTKAVKIADALSMGVKGFRSGSILPSFDIDPTTGDLFVVWSDGRFTGADQVAMSVSRDGGDTWTTPARVNDGPAMVPAMTVSVAANRAGEILVGYYTQRNADPSATIVDYYVNRSVDGGNTFEEGVRVTRKSFDASAAALAGGRELRIFLGDYVGLAGSDEGFYAVFTAALKRSKLGAGRQADIFASVSR